MESEEIVEEEVLRVLDSCISRIKWRLRSSSKRRLQTDILALCTGMRPVVMVDYGGKMPELQEQLCLLLHLCHKESSILWPLRVMIIQDMVYLIHVSGLAEHVQSGLSLQQQMLFVDLEQDPPKMVMQSEQSLVASQLASIQNFFSSVFSVDETNKDISQKVPPPMTGLKMESAEHSGADELVASQYSELINLSSCMQDTEVTLPTLNGWLLGYPVVYLSGKEHMADAIYNLSTKSLHLFKILVGRNGTSGKGPCQEELMRWVFHVMFVTLSYLKYFPLLSLTVYLRALLDEDQKRFFLGNTWGPRIWQGASHNICVPIIPDQRNCPEKQQRQV